MALQPAPKWLVKEYNDRMRERLAVLDHDVQRVSFEPTTALLDLGSLTLGWSGSLAALRVKHDAVLSGRERSAHWPATPTTRVGTPSSAITRAAPTRAWSLAHASS